HCDTRTLVGGGHEWENINSRPSPTSQALPSGHAMERNRPSADVSQKLKLAVLVLVPVSNLFLLIALVSNNWINANGKDGFEYLGLWRGCNSQGCGLLVGG
ncbi:hypothetical protein FKM82_022489, partial [Ascaphus truei]